jgi:hypothetical protein
MRKMTAARNNEQQAGVNAVMTSQKGAAVTVPFLTGDAPAAPHAGTEWVLVTPDIAGQLLKTMHVNRNTSRIEVTIHEQNLRDGVFYSSISPVYLDDGKPARAWDGKHRFEAIRNTGISAWLLFIYGVTAEEARYADTGRRRSYADTLKIEGVPDYGRQSALARALALYDEFGIEGFRNPGQFAVSRAKLDKWVAAPGVHESCKLAEALYRATTVNSGYAAYAIYRTGRGQDPDGFWERVRSGEGLVLGDPALTLRNWLMRSRREGGRAPADAGKVTKYTLATAWNKNVLGEHYAKVIPTYERKKSNGALFFPASNIPDFLPLNATPTEKRRAARRGPYDGPGAKA